MNARAQRAAGRLLAATLATVICAAALIPFLWMVSGSFKEQSEIFRFPPVWIPRVPTLKGYIGLSAGDIFGSSGFFTFAVNSVFVAVTTAAVSILAAALAGYSMSRFKLRGRVLVKYTILASQMMPGALLLIPLYMFVNSLRLINNDWSLVVAYTSFTLPYCTYILKNYFDSIPRSLDEAAMVDGCGRLGALFRVVFPLSAPGVIVTFTSAFIFGWNEYLFALTFLNDYSVWTLPLFLGSFQGQYLVQWGYLFAGSVVVTLPVVVLFLVLQRWLAAGFVSGAIKA